VIMKIFTVTFNDGVCNSFRVEKNLENLDI